MLPVKSAQGFYSNRYLLLLGIAIIVLVGLSAFNNLPRIEDPHITPRYPRIITEYPGASAQRVEALVTDPIEDALREIVEIKEINSVSTNGLSFLNLELKDQVGPGENERVFSKIRDQLNSVSVDLPIEVSQPELDDKFSAVAFSNIVAVSWTNDDKPQLGIMTRLAEDIADIMRNIPGSDIVRVYGAPEEEVSVIIDSAVLADLGLTTASIAQIINNADSKLPAGAIRNDNSALLIDVAGEIDLLERIRKIPIIAASQTIANGGTIDSANVLLLENIATIKKQWKLPTRDIALIDGKRSVLVGTRTNKNVRLDRWAMKAEQKINQFKTDFGGGIDIEIIFNQNIYTERRLLELGNNLLAGAFIVVLIVLFSMGFRSSLIVGSALPLTGALALFGLVLLGQQLHQMAIFGMIIAIGLLIDNAIVMTDEIKKNLDNGRSPMDAIEHSIKHLFVPLFASTLTTVLGFMPIFLLPAAMGDFVGPIAIAVVLSLIGSFFVATTIIPAFCALFLKPATKMNESHRRYSWFRDGIDATILSLWYRALLQKMLIHPLLTIAAVVGFAVTGFMLSSTLGQQFFPPADRNQFEIEVNLPYDASIERTTAMVESIEKELLQYQGIDAVHWRIGGTFPTIYYNKIMTVDGNSSYAHAIITTDSLQRASDLIEKLRLELEQKFTDAQIIVAPFAQGPPVGAPIAIEILGPDNKVLKSLGDELRKIMHQVPGIVATNATVIGGLPKLKFIADESKVAQAGLTLQGVSRQIQSNLEGYIGGSLQDNLKQLPIRVRIPAEQRSSIDDIRDLPIVSPYSDDWIPASSLGHFELISDISSVSRKQGARANVVLGYIDQDYLVIDVSNAIEAQIKKQGFTMPANYQLNISGDSAEQAEAFGLLFTYLPALLMLMVTTIILSFRSFRLAATIFTVAILSSAMECSHYGLEDMLVGSTPLSVVLVW